MRRVFEKLRHFYNNISAFIFDKHFDMVNHQNVQIRYQTYFFLIPLCFVKGFKQGYESMNPLNKA